MKRLSDEWNVEDDCIVSNTFPLRESDPPGIYLGRDRSGNPLYITYWVALEVAQLVGYPPLEVVEQLQKDYDELSGSYDALSASIDDRAAEHVEQKYIKLLQSTKDDILEAQERTHRSVRDASKFGGVPGEERGAKLTGRKGVAE